MGLDYRTACSHGPASAEVREMDGRHLAMTGRERLEVGAGLEPTEGLTLEGRWSGGRASTFGETEVSAMDLGSGWEEGEQIHPRSEEFCG